MFKVIILFFLFFLITGCSFTSSSDSSSVSNDSSSESMFFDESEFNIIVEDDAFLVEGLESVLDIPGASEQAWSPFFISDLAANSFQHAAPGNVLVFDESLPGSNFNVISGDSLEVVDLLVYDGVSYSPGLRIISTGESIVEVIASDRVSVLFSFTVIS
jgi:hypothetical protein